MWANIAEIRRAEMDQARAILGVRQAWLGFVDSGLPEGDPLPPLPEGCFALAGLDDAAGAAGPADPRVPPAVVITYDEKGGYPHPDHIMCHKVSVAAFDAAGDPDRYPEAGEPWQPLKLYYNMGFSKDAVRRAARGDARRRPGVAVRASGWSSWTESDDDRTRARGSPPGCRAPTTSRSATTRCGRTPPRSTRTASGSGCRWRSSRPAWPTEDYELARSLVDSPLPGGRPVRRQSAETPAPAEPAAAVTLDGRSVAPRSGGSC